MNNRPCNLEGKQCGLCCKVMAIKELRKPAGEWCRHWDKSHGCNVHGLESYPQECRDFNCMYVMTEKHIPELFPKKIKVVIAQCNVIPDVSGIGCYVDKVRPSNAFLANLVNNHKNPVWFISWWKKTGVAVNKAARVLVPRFNVVSDFDEEEVP